MGDKSGIEWTDATWNPVAGCSPVSEGCRNCYAARQALRMGSNPNEKVRAAYGGTAEMRGTDSSRRAVFTGRVNLLADRLDQPLRWKRPRRVFVNSMSDLFHPDVPFEFIDLVFAVMALAPQHTFQVLTKRPHRMAEYMVALARQDRCLEGLGELHAAAAQFGIGTEEEWEAALTSDWPLHNVWLGTSVENQEAAEERIPPLIRTPAAVRFLSCEPLLGPVKIRRGWVHAGFPAHITRSGCSGANLNLHWVIVGGESGPGARPCDVAWIRDLVRQCGAAGVATFVKQLGAVVWDRNDAGFDTDAEVWTETGEPTCPTAWPEPLEVEHDVRGFREEYQGAPVRVRLRSTKGGDPSEWPSDLRVRQMPDATEAT